MRYFGLYFAFFSFAFSYIFKVNINVAMETGANTLFSYFVFTSAISLSVAIVLFVALKKGLRFMAVSPFFGGLFNGAAGAFFLNLLANRIALLTGSYMLTLAVGTSDTYLMVASSMFLALGYTVFRPFNFDFKGGFGAKKEFQNAEPMERTTTIDVEVIEDFERLEKK
jgi:hypothetical protein